MSIFISYRRADAAGHAQNLHDRLRSWFDDSSELFFDGQNIDSGQDFPNRLEEAVDAAAVVLVLIGPGWLDEVKRRAALPAVDFVRVEVERALARLQRGEALRVIPVLLGGAGMPSVTSLEGALQASLAGLCRLDAHAFQGKQGDWESQFVRLRSLIAAAPGAPRERYRDRSGKPRPWRVIEHALSPNFQDPNDLMKVLHVQLTGGATAALIGAGRANAAAVHGMGGIGKTQLALAYSYAFRDAYAGIWWFRAETGTGSAANDALLQQDALAACVAAGVPVGERELPMKALKRWLAGQSAPWLLVYDNADDPGALRAHLPGPGPHHAIITSRRPDWGGLARTVELDTWTPVQGAQFLVERLGAVSSLPDAVALAQATGGLPLALEQAASYVEAQGTTLAQYLALWQAKAGPLLDMQTVTSGYEHTVSATLALAIDRLSPAAQELVRLLAFAAPEPLPERIFTLGHEHLPPELEMAATNPLAWDGVAGELRRYAIARRDQIPSLDRQWLAGGAALADTPTELALVMHRLTQHAVRGHESAAARATLQTLAAIALQAIPSGAQDPRSWPILSALVPHATWLFEETQIERRRGETSITEDLLLLEAVSGFIWLGLGLQMQARMQYEHVLAARRRVLGDEHPDTLVSMNNLAITLRALGDLVGARVRQEQVSAISCRVLGEEHAGTLTSMNNLAGTLWAQGDLAGARDLHQQVLAVQRRVLGDEHPDTLISMANLAYTMRELGDLAGARALEEHTLTVRRRVLGEEHPGTLTSMANLAASMRAQGDLAGGRALAEQVLAVRRRVLGDEHPETLTSMNDLGHILLVQGDPAGARAVLEQAYASSQRVLGAEHPETLNSMMNVASTLAEQGDLAGARTLHEQVLATRRRVQGDEHPDTLTSMNNLAYVAWALGDRSEAIRLMKLAATGFAARFGGNHPYAQNAAEVLAQWLMGGSHTHDE